ncbi:MAG: hypothetical protein PF487_04425 [Bacteroidales bacterium]|jgi:hypothetical protein|nr:hypothetical protein [Bacteroidales bacterium]
MARLNIKRQQTLEPKRMEHAITEINNKGYNVEKVSDKEIRFKFLGQYVYYFPYSGWHSGKNIVDGRGLNKLIKQL